MLRLFGFLLSQLGLVVLLTSCSGVERVSPPKGKNKAQYRSESENVMIATQGSYATQAGLEMIKMGGNIFDAAAAISFVIAVERPQSTGIGGGGFLLMDGPDFPSPITLDFREKAPIYASKNMYLKKNGKVSRSRSRNGPLAVAVPGLVKGVLEMHRKHGKLARVYVMKPAINLASQGFKVYPHLANAIKSRQKTLRKYPASQRIFLPNGKPLTVGETLVQSDLAKTLTLIANEGEKAFYQGEIASRIVHEMKKSGGLISLSDLRQYETKWRDPVQGTYNGHVVYSMGPPSSGGAHLIQILNLMEAHDLKKLKIHAPESVHWKTSAMQLAFIDRARYMGDQDFVKVPLSKLTSKDYAKTLSGLIEKDKATDLKAIDIPRIPREAFDTTHFTIMDKEGNVVTSTQTINGLMGSGLVIPGTGILMNNEMDDFSAKTGASNMYGAIGGENNSIEPRKRPLSSMSPTLVKRDGKPVLALGSPNGTRIITCVANVIMNAFGHQMDLWNAVQAKRIHHQWRPNKIFFEKDALSSSTVKKLTAMGYQLKEKAMGCKVQAVGSTQGKLYGVSDMRGEGMAKGM